MRFFWFRCSFATRRLLLAVKAASAAITPVSPVKIAAMASGVIADA